MVSIVGKKEVVRKEMDIKNSKIFIIKQKKIFFLSIMNYFQK
jgi:hypothetical protein